MDDRNTCGRTKPQCTHFLGALNSIELHCAELVKAHPNLLYVHTIKTEAKGSVAANLVLCRQLMPRAVP